jgi:tryptophanase
MYETTVMRGDESYGRNWGYYCLLDAFRDIIERGNEQQRVYEKVVSGMLDTNYYRNTLLIPHENGFVNGGPHQLARPNFFIVPQGRCAENLLFSTMASMIAEGEKTKAPPAIISNGFFDTTGANAAVAGFELQTFTQPGLSDAFPHHLVGKENPFKGNLDVKATETYLDEHPGHVVMILTTITNNWAAAQPVSMANIRSTAELAKRKDIPFFFDACRFAENAFFIRQYENGYATKSIAEIVQEMFSYVDGFTISLKKDGLSNMGGVLSFRDKGMFTTRYEGIGLRLKERQILSYGNDSYGGSESFIPTLCYDQKLINTFSERPRSYDCRNWSLRSHQIKLSPQPHRASSILRAKAPIRWTIRALSARGTRRLPRYGRLLLRLRQKAR